MDSIVFRNIDDLRPYVDQWMALARQHASNVFQTPGWVIPWWETYGDQHELLVIAVFQAGNLIGLAPLMITRQEGRRTVQFIGSPLNDYNEFLLRQETREAVGSALLETLLACAPEWHIFELFLIADFQASTGSSFNAASKKAYIQYQQAEPAPILALPSSLEQYLKSLPANRSRHFDYLKRRLWRDILPELHIHTLPHAIIDYIAGFDSQRLLSWKHRGRLDQLPEMIKTASFLRFIEKSACMLTTTDSMRFAVIENGSGIIAAGLYLSTYPRLLKYMQCWSYDNAQLSPGTVLDWAMIEYAIKAGYSLFDFGRGAEEYKFRYGASNYHLQNVIITHDQRLLASA